MNEFVEKFDRLLLLTLKHGVNNKLEISTTVRRGLKGTPNHPCRIVPSKTSDHGMLNGELSHQRSFGIKLYFQGMFSVNSQHFEIFGIWLRSCRLQWTHKRLPLALFFPWVPDIISSFQGSSFQNSTGPLFQPEKLQYNLYNFVLVIHCILTNAPQKST